MALDGNEPTVGTLHKFVKLGFLWLLQIGSAAFLGCWIMLGIVTCALTAPGWLKEPDPNAIAVGICTAIVYFGVLVFSVIVTYCSLTSLLGEKRSDVRTAGSSSGILARFGITIGVVLKSGLFLGLTILACYIASENERLAGQDGVDIKFWCSLYIAAAILAATATITLVLDRKRSEQTLVSDRFISTIKVDPAWILILVLGLPSVGLSMYYKSWDTLASALAFQTSATAKDRANDRLRRQLATGYSRDKIEDCLRAGADINLPGYQGTALMHAASAADEDFVRMLIAEGANVNFIDGRKQNALVESLEITGSRKEITPSKRRIALYLIQHGASLAPPNEWTNPLTKAIQASDKDLVSRMLDAGAIVKRLPSDCSCGSPIMAAASRGDKETIDLLLSHGADINEIDQAGDSALTSAARSGKTDTVEFLIEKGANVRGKAGTLALNHAQKLNYKKMYEALAKAGAAVAPVN